MGKYLHTLCPGFINSKDEHSSPRVIFADKSQLVVFGQSQLQWQEGPPPKTAGLPLQRLEPPLRPKELMGSAGKVMTSIAGPGRIFPKPRLKCLFSSCRKGQWNPKQVPQGKLPFQLSQFKRVSPSEQRREPSEAPQAFEGCWLGSGEPSLHMKIEFRQEGCSLMGREGGNLSLQKALPDLRSSRASCKITFSS